MKKIVISLFLFGFCLSAITSANEQSPSLMSLEQGHWSAPPLEAKRQNPIPRIQASIDQGKTLFQKHCVVCHGPAGRGDGPAAANLNPKPTNLVQMAGHHSDGDIAWKIENGRGAMPAWKNILKEDDIWHVTNFIQSL